MSDLSKSWRAYANKLRSRTNGHVAMFDTASLELAAECADDVAQELEVQETADIEITINMEMARLIRQWRVQYGSAYRKVAERFGSLFPTHTYGDGTQKSGMLLCAEAAILHKENPTEPPWDW